MLRYSLAALFCFHSSLEHWSWMRSESNWRLCHGVFTQGRYAEFAILFPSSQIQKLQKTCFCQNWNLVGMYEFSFKSQDNFDWSQRTQAPCFNTPRKGNIAGNGTKGAFNFPDTESVGGWAHARFSLIDVTPLSNESNQQMLSNFRKCGHKSYRKYLWAEKSHQSA